MPPKHVRLKEELVKRIRAGEFVPGAKLPSQRDLRDEYRLSYTTVNRAVQELIREGLVETTVGSGAVVTDGAPGLVRGPFVMHCPVGEAAAARNFGVFQGLLEAAASLAMEVDVRVVPCRADKVALARSISPRRGGVAVPYFAGHGPFVDELRARRVPYVVVDVPIEVSGHPIVLCDHRAGAARLAGRLLEVGHEPERVGVIATRKITGDPHQWNRAKLFGFLDALDRKATHPLVARLPAHRTPEDGVAQGAAAARRLLDARAGVTAFAVDDSYRALGVARELARRALRVPRDVSIVSINRIETWEGYAAAPTYAWAPMRRIGEAAGRLLHGILARTGEPLARERVEMIYERGGSVAAPGRTTR